MELTRRDAVAALATLGSGVGSGCLDRALGERTQGTETLATLTAAAEVGYPSTVTGHESFVLVRLEECEGYYSGLQSPLDALDERAREWFDASFADLSPADRDALLEQVGADYRDPDPEGLLGGRVRYYVVNELLDAFYASPKGGRLAGIENPVGHPSSIQSYQRGSMPEGDDG